MEADSEFKFWSLLTSIDRVELEKESMDDKVIANLVHELSKLTNENLEAFQENLAQALFRLDGKGYAMECTEQGSSADGFLYARCYVVARGKDYYDSVLASPALMPKEFEQCEQLLYAAETAWNSRGESTEWTYVPSVSYETGSNQDAWQ